MTDSNTSEFADKISNDIIGKRTELLDKLLIFYENQQQQTQQQKQKQTQEQTEQQKEQQKEQHEKIEKIKELKKLNLIHPDILTDINNIISEYEKYKDKHSIKHKLDDINDDNNEITIT